QLAGVAAGLLVATDSISELIAPRNAAGRENRRRPLGGFGSGAGLRSRRARNCQLPGVACYPESPATQSLLAHARQTISPCRIEIQPSGCAPHSSQAADKAPRSSSVASDLASASCANCDLTARSAHSSAHQGRVVSSA